MDITPKMLCVDRIRNAYYTVVGRSPNSPQDTRDRFQEARAVTELVDAEFCSAEFDTLSIAAKWYVMGFEQGLREAYGSARGWPP
jgi:hypothetical protein